MSDRYYAFTVTLEKDLRDDDAQALIGAIAMFRGVLSVKPHTTDVQALMACERARAEWTRKILNLLDESKL